MLPRDRYTKERPIRFKNQGLLVVGAEPGTERNIERPSIRVKGAGPWRRSLAVATPANAARKTYPGRRAPARESCPGQREPPGETYPGQGGTVKRSNPTRPARIHRS